MMLPTARNAVVSRLPSFLVFLLRRRPAIMGAAASYRAKACHHSAVAALSAHQGCAQGLTRLTFHRLFAKADCELSPEAAKYVRLVTSHFRRAPLRERCVQSAQPIRPVDCREESSASTLRPFDNCSVRAHNHLAGGSRQCVNRWIILACSDDRSPSSDAFRWVDPPQSL
jgi:hypothetical protein